jgi:hypothetical protein
MGLTGMAFSVVSMAVGAVLYWAMKAQSSGFRLSTIGVILMVIGAVGFFASTMLFVASRRPVGTARRSYDREVTDAHGQSTAVHEEVR